MTSHASDTTSADYSDEEHSFSPFELLVPLARRWRTLVLVPILTGAIAYGGSFLLRETYSAGVTFIPPQQQPSIASAALASLGTLGNLAGASGVRNPGEQYASLLQTLAVRDRLIDEFKLLEVYRVDYRVDALKRLSEQVRVNIGKRDGLLGLEVDDESPQRAADMANRHIELLRELTNKLALTEAQQRRVFFEGQLRQTKERLTEAQRQLQTSGFDASALRTEPKASAESYARLRAEVTAAEARLRASRQALNDAAPEVQQQLALLESLRAQLRSLETTTVKPAGADYVGMYREYKYQETLFELFSRQFELARLDESKEGALIQVVDAAKKPEKRSSPKRRVIVLGATLGSLLLLVIGLVASHLMRRAAEDPVHTDSLQRLRDALRRR